MLFSAILKRKRCFFSLLRATNLHNQIISEQIAIFKRLGDQDSNESSSDSEMILSPAHGRMESCSSASPLHLSLSQLRHLSQLQPWITYFPTFGVVRSLRQ